VLIDDAAREWGWMGLGDETVAMKDGRPEGEKRIRRGEKSPQTN